MLIGELPEDTTVSNDGFLLYSEDGVHALKIRKKNAFESGVTVYYGIANPENLVGMSPKDGDIYFKLNGSNLESSTQITRIYVYVNSGNSGKWVPSSFAHSGDVTWTQLYNSGEHIATITIDGYNIPVYAPNGGTQIQISDVLYSGIDIATININGTDFVIKAPSGEASESLSDVVFEYEEDGQTHYISVVDENNIAKILLDPDTLIYSGSNGLSVKMRTADNNVVINTPDFTTDNAAPYGITFNNPGYWMITLGAYLGVNAAYTSNDPSEYIYLKGVGDCFDNGFIEERVPICLFDGEVPNTHTITVSGIAHITETNKIITPHIGGTLLNAVSSANVAVFIRGFRMGG